MSIDMISALSLAEQEQIFIKKEIVSGKYGKPGDPFLTTRALAEKRQISLVTAHSVLKGLCESDILELKGKHYYISNSSLINQYINEARAIGLLIPQINNEFFSSLADAVVAAAQKNGFHVLIMTTSYDREQEKTALKMMLKYDVCGIISCVPTCEENEGIYKSYPIPCILLAHSINKSEISSVQVNSFTILQKVARYFVEEGYRRFIYIGTEKIQSENDVRFAAFNMEIKRQGFVLNSDDIIRFSGDRTRDEAMLVKRLAEIDEPVGIFCYHDLIAATVYKVCANASKRIPEDVGVIGFDDLSVASTLNPPLTTVQYRVAAMAETAINLLTAKMISATAPYYNYYIEPNLVIRKSAELSKTNDKTFV